MILGKHIDIIADGQRVTGTITEIGIGYCVVTDSLGKQYHVRGYDIPPTHRAWAYPEYPFRAVDADGGIGYFEERPYTIAGEQWFCDGMCKGGGYYDDLVWSRANWSKTVQHRDEVS